MGWKGRMMRCRSGCGPEGEGRLGRKSIVYKAMHHVLHVFLLLVWPVTNQGTAATRAPACLAFDLSGAGAKCASQVRRGLILLAMPLRRPPLRSRRCCWQQTVTYLLLLIWPVTSRGTAATLAPVCPAFDVSGAGAKCASPVRRELILKATLPTLPPMPLRRCCWQQTVTNLILLIWPVTNQLAPACPEAGAKCASPVRRELILLAMSLRRPPLRSRWRDLQQTGQRSTGPLPDRSEKRQPPLLPR